MRPPRRRDGTRTSCGRIQRRHPPARPATPTRLLLSHPPPALRCCREPVDDPRPLPSLLPRMTVAQAATALAGSSLSERSIRPGPYRVIASSFALRCQSYRPRSLTTTARWLSTLLPGTGAVHSPPPGAACVRRRYQAPLHYSLRLSVRAAYCSLSALPRWSPPPPPCLPATVVGQPSCAPVSPLIWAPPRARYRSSPFLPCFPRWELIPSARCAGACAAAVRASVSWRSVSGRDPFQSHQSTLFVLRCAPVVSRCPQSVPTDLFALPKRR